MVLGCKAMSYCGVVEVRGLEDALGATCGLLSNAQCSDCGISLCSAHADRYSTTPQRAKAASAERSAGEKRKSA
jgi:hypothetical protein